MADADHGSPEQRGDCRIDVFLTGVTPDQVDEVVERIADVLAEAGLGAADEDAPIRSMLGVKPFAFPDFEDEQVVAGIADEYSEWILPAAEESTWEDD